MSALAEQPAAEKSDLKNSRGNGYGLRLRKRRFFELVSTATTTTRKTDQETAATATEKTTLNQVHSGPKTGSTSHRLGESQTRLLIPSLNRDTGSVYIYKTAHHPQLSFDHKRPAVEAALATAAAPSYFPAHISGGGTPLIDGGMWANNPVLFGIIEAVGMCGQAPSDIEVLSLGCTETPFDVQPRRFSGLGFWAWKAKDAFMAGQSSASLGASRILLGDAGRIVRVSPVMSDGRFSLDGVAGIASLVGLGQTHARESFPAIAQRFFAAKVPKFVPYHKLVTSGDVESSARSISD